MRKLYFLILIAIVLAAIFYFAPAFRGEIIVSPDLYIFGVRIHFYGLFLAAAILAAFFVGRKFAPRFGMEEKKIEDMLFWAVLGGFLAARLYFVFFSWNYFQNHPGEIWQFWKGGLSIYGGIIGGFLGVFFYSRFIHSRIKNFLDLAAIALPLAQSIGRFGNFFNQEAFGLPTNLPWKMYVSPRFRPEQFLEQRFFHPTFLYEAIWNLVVFGILWNVFARKQESVPGLVLGTYLVLYSLGRFFIESLRLDSFIFHGIRVDQAVALLAVAIGGVIIFISHAKNQPQNNL